MMSAAAIIDLSWTDDAAQSSVAGRDKSMLQLLSALWTFQLTDPAHAKAQKQLGMDGDRNLAGIGMKRLGCNHS